MRRERNSFRNSDKWLAFELFQDTIEIETEQGIAAYPPGAARRAVESFASGRFGQDFRHSVLRACINAERSEFLASGDGI